MVGAFFDFGEGDYLNIIGIEPDSGNYWGVWADGSMKRYPAEDLRFFAGIAEVFRPGPEWQL